MEENNKMYTFSHPNKNPKQPKASVPILNPCVSKCERTPAHLFPGVNLVLPLLTLCYRALYTPYQIKYNEKSRQFYYSQGSCLRKIAVSLWQSVTLLYTIWGYTAATMIETPNFAKGFNSIHKLSYILFNIHQVVWIVLMWSRLQMIPLLLNETTSIYNYLIKHDKQKLPSCFNSQNFVTMFKLLLFFITTCFVVISTLAYLSHDISIDTGIVDGMDQLANSTISSFCKIQGFWCTLQDSDTYSVKVAIYLITTLWVIVAVGGECAWLLSILLLACWGLYFRKLLVLGLRLIKRSTGNTEVLTAFELCTRITLNLETFNDIFGANLLTSVIAIIMFKSTSFGIFLSGNSFGCVGDALTLVSFVPLLAMLGTTAEVHRMGSRIPDLLKKKYILQKESHDPISLQILHGSIIIQYDILANNIGCKGLGFFTISYAFAGSLVGIIITYSLVSLQLARNI